MKYTLNPRNIKYTCPQCGSRKSLKRYIDTETGQDLDPLCGRCDHVNRCQYHYTPAQLFRDHPELRHGSLGLAMPPVTAGPYRATEPPVLEQRQFFPSSWASAAMERPSTLSRWMQSLPLDPQRTAQVMRLYALGGTANSVVKDGIDYGPAAVFWMIDQHDRIHDAKLLAYTPDGHRVPEWSNSMRSICQKSGKGPQLDHTDKVLFGLHLTAQRPEDPVAIVESEKTALLCAIQWPQYIWLATGGCGNLQPDKLQPLVHRRLILYPDSGQYDKWSQKMSASGHSRYTISNRLESYPPNTDIADLLVKALFSHAEAPAQPMTGSSPAAMPKIHQQPPKTQPEAIAAEEAYRAMAQRNPALVEFRSMLGFEPTEATQE